MRTLVATRSQIALSHPMVRFFAHEVFASRRIARERASKLAHKLAIFVTRSAYTLGVDDLAVRVLDLLPCTVKNAIVANRAEWTVAEMRLTSVSSDVRLPRRRGRSLASDAVSALGVPLGSSIERDIDADKFAFHAQGRAHDDEAAGRRIDN